MFPWALELRVARPNVVVALALRPGLLQAHVVVALRRPLQHFAFGDGLVRGLVRVPDEASAHDRCGRRCTHHLELWPVLAVAAPWRDVDIVHDGAKRRVRSSCARSRGAHQHQHQAPAHLRDASGLIVLAGSHVVVMALVHYELHLLRPRDPLHVDDVRPPLMFSPAWRKRALSTSHFTKHMVRTLASSPSPSLP